MFYTIVFWFFLGFIIGCIFATLVWFYVLGENARLGRLFIKSGDGKWIPREPK
jgi:hypothetical protein